MPYDLNGLWKPEDDSVANKVTGLLATDSPLITQAQTKAKASANQRGLLNSSMAVQAGQEAAFSAVLPIASQDASQTAQKNLSGQAFKQDTSIQAQQIQGQKDLQASDNAANMQRLTTQISSNEKLAADENALKLGIANLDVASQQKIAQMNISSTERINATNAAVNMSQVYANAYNSVMSNEKLTAAEREAQLTHISALMDSNFGLVEQIYGVDLQWASPTGGGRSGIPGTPATGGGTNPIPGTGSNNGGNTTPVPTQPVKPTSPAPTGYEYAIVDGNWVLNRINPSWKIGMSRLWPTGKPPSYSYVLIDGQLIAKQN
jgi:hypothetical protein